MEKDLQRNVYFKPCKLLGALFGRSFCHRPLTFEEIRSSSGTPIVSSFSSLFNYKVEVPVIDCDLSTPPPESENELFYDVVANGLQGLARVTLNNSYKQLLNDEFVPLNSDVAGSSGGTNRISCWLIGIGNRKLWWGEPDACVRPLESDTLHSNSTLIVANRLDEDSDGASSLVEAKQKLRHDHLPQGVATAIVHSFTQNKRHPGLNPMVPTVLINGSDFRIILYDCSRDVLLLSNPVEYRDGSKMTPLGTLVLWLTIHHRYLYCVCVCVCVCCLNLM